jgi:hypothetical protein
MRFGTRPTNGCSGRGEAAALDSDRSMLTLDEVLNDAAESEDFE